MSEHRPRGKSREYPSAPTERPSFSEEEITRLFQLGEFLDKVTKSPVLDDLTGYYQLRPDKRGVMAYTSRPKLRQFAGKTAIGPEMAKDLLGRRERQPVHIAESAERATGIFLAVAKGRETVLARAVHSIAQQEPIERSVALHAADAIADYGYCLDKPKNIPLSVITRKSELDVGLHLMNFGAYAITDPGALTSYEGVALLQATLDEQERRIAFWEPRYQAITDQYGTQVPATEFSINMNLEQLLALESELR